MKKVFLLFAMIGMASFKCFSEEKNDSIRSFQLQEVRVTSIRATEKTPVAYSNVDKKEIEKANFGKDIPFLLTLTPSVVATSDAGAGIGYTKFRVRGTDDNRINITANGVPLNDAESQSVFWVNMPDFASSIEDLQVQRGVGTSTNGAGAFGASINMKTENIPSQAYGELNASYGSFNTYKTTAKLGTGILGDHWAFDARLSDIHSDGYIDRATTDLKSYFFQAGYFQENTLLKFIVFGGKEKTYHAWDGLPKDSLKTNRTYNSCGYMGNDANGNPMYYKDQTDNYLQTNYQLMLLHVFNPYLNLNATLHYTNGEGYYEEYKTKRTLIQYGLIPFIYDGKTVEKSDLVRQKWLDNDFGGFVFSLNYKKDKWDASLGGAANKYWGNHFGKVIWIKNYAEDRNFLPDHEYYRNDAQKSDANIYLKANYAAFDKLSIYGDIQYRFIDYRIEGKNDVWDWRTNVPQSLDIHKTFNFFNPKAGVFFNLNAYNNFYASFAVGHREPNRKNYTNAAENENPTYETLYDYEAGYTFRNKTFSAGLNFYYMKYNNQLVLTGKVNEIGEMLTSNVPDSYRMGVEMLLGSKITSWLHWNGNLTLSRNKIKDYSEFVNVLDENWEPTGEQIENKLGTTSISFSPGIIANSIFSFNYNNWNAALQSSYVGKQYIDNTSNEERKLDPYFVNNLRLGYEFKLKSFKSLGISLLINNLFNGKYESNAWVESYYAPSASGDGSLVRGEYSGFFPQAGTNVLVNLSLKF